MDTWSPFCIHHEPRIFWNLVLPHIETTTGAREARIPLPRSSVMNFVFPINVWDKTQRMPSPEYTKNSLEYISLKHNLLIASVPTCPIRTHPHGRPTGTSTITLTRQPTPPLHAPPPTSLSNLTVEPRAEIIRRIEIRSTRQPLRTTRNPDAQIKVRPNLIHSNFSWTILHIVKAQSSCAQRLRQIPTIR